MISHTIPAAGVAAIIKVALALHHKVLPPTLNCDEPNPKLGLDVSPFYINSSTRPWVHGGAEPRRAGVNAFGFGGINAHAVLEEYRPDAGPAPRRSNRRPRRCRATSKNGTARSASSAPGRRPSCSIAPSGWRPGSMRRPRGLPRDCGTWPILSPSNSAGRARPTACGWRSSRNRSTT